MPPAYVVLCLLYTKHYHCLHYVVGPSEFSWSLTSRHALPVLVNKRYDVLRSEVKNRQRMMKAKMGDIHCTWAESGYFKCVHAKCEVYEFGR